MTRTMLIALAVCTLTGIAQAQWPDYPTPDVPRNADGSVNLDAPAPRMAELNTTANASNIE